MCKFSENLNRHVFVMSVLAAGYLWFDCYDPVVRVSTEGGEYRELTKPFVCTSLLSICHQN